MRAYHGDPAIKLKYIGRVTAHQKADDLIHGTYWTNGKGCAVGCTIHSDEHKAYETELGMPEWFALLEDEIFECMSVAASRCFPIYLLYAVPVGFAEWDRLYHEFCAYLLNDICMFDMKASPDAATAMNNVMHLHERWTKAGDQEWTTARKAAWVESRSARSAAEWAARSAAESAEWSAHSAAWSARSAAWSAAWSVAWSARSAARSAAYDRMANWLMLWFNAANRSR